LLTISRDKIDKIYDNIFNENGKVYFVGDTLTVTKTTALYECLIILSKLGNVIFSNLPQSLFNKEGS